jgi:hypothetical protein
MLRAPSSSQMNAAFGEWQRQFSFETLSSELCLCVKFQISAAMTMKIIVI